MATDKPRYRYDTATGGLIPIDTIQSVVAEAQRAGSTTHKPRYRGEFRDGELRIKPTQPPPPGRLSGVENSVLRTLGNQERGGQVPLTYFPTRTSNPADPRTAAAGYDSATQTLRVEWGDGGAAYNYYEVTPGEWRDFQRSASPGKFINRRLNVHPYGPA